MQSASKRNYYRRKYYRKFRRYKKVSDQVLRMKLDRGTLIHYPLNQGAIGFEYGTGANIIGFNDVITNSQEMEQQTNVFTQFFSRMKLYAIRFVITPTKALPAAQTLGASTYFGFVIGKNGDAPNVGTARNMSTAYQLPSYGAPPLQIFYRLKGNPWFETGSAFLGYFFVCSNQNMSRDQGPMWEVRMSCYVKFTNNTM